MLPSYERQISSSSGRYEILISSLIYLLLTAALLTYGSAQIPAATAPNRPIGADWSHVNFDHHATGFNPQTQITKENINSLELKWIFPFPDAPADLGGYGVGALGGALGAHQGSQTTPLIVNGLVIFGTNWGSVYALDGRSGEIIWTYEPELNLEEDLNRNLPLYLEEEFLFLGFHTHGFNYFDGMLFIPQPPCDVHILNVDNGKLIRNVGDTCNIGPEDGNVGLFKGPQSYGPVIYEKERIMVVPAGVVTEAYHGGRGFVAGYSIDTGELLWRFFITPPAGGDPNWTLDVAEKGWIQGIRASDLPRESLINDWGKSGETGQQAGPAWGQWAVDEESGIVYVGTAQPSPDWNATYRPGPNVFADSIVALDARSGDLIWWHQTTAHDLWDWDCSWNVVLSTIGDRKVIFKGCKNGVMEAFDASDGERIWSFDPPAIKRCDDCFLLDPRDPEEMKKGWLNYPSTEATWQNPPGSGGIEADITVAYEKVYVATYNSWSYLKIIPVEPDRPIPPYGGAGLEGLPPPEIRPTNTTIYALDASTGDVVWTFFIDAVGYRGGLIASGGMVFASSFDGNIYALDAETGEKIWTKFLGTGLALPPSIGADGDGNMKMVQVFGGQFSFWSKTVPGSIVVFGLPDETPPEESPDVGVIVTPPETPEIVETISPLTYLVLGTSLVLFIASAILFTRRRN